MESPLDDGPMLGNGLQGSPRDDTGSPVTVEQHRLVDDGQGGHVVQIMVKQGTEGGDEDQGQGQMEEEEEEQDMEEMLEDDEDEVLSPPPQKRLRMRGRSRTESVHDWHNTDPANSQRNCKLYGCEMMRQMKEFLEKGDFCDVILLSTKSSEVLQAHKLVLGASSAHLRALLLLGEDCLDTLPVDVSGEALSALRTYFYSGTATLTPSMAAELATVAAEWELTALQTLCKSLQSSAPSEQPSASAENAGIDVAITEASQFQLSAAQDTVALVTQDDLEGEEASEHREMRAPRDPFLGAAVKRELDDEGISADSEPEDAVVSEEPERLGVAAYGPLLGEAGRSPVLHAMGDSEGEAAEERPLATLQVVEEPDGSDNAVKPEPADADTDYGHMPAGVSVSEETADGWAPKLEPAASTSSLLDASGTPAGCLYRCYVCKVVFSDVQTCLAHLSTAHGAKQNLVVSSTAPPTMEVPEKVATPDPAPPPQGKEEVFYQCTSCKKHFADIGTCKAHILAMHTKKAETPAAAEGPYHCYICQKTFPTATAGRTHSLMEHCHSARPQNTYKQIQFVGDEEASSSRKAARVNNKDSAVSDVIDLSEVLPAGSDWDDYPFPNHPYQCNFCKLIFAKLGQCETHIHETHNIEKDLVYVCYTRRKNRYKNKPRPQAPSPQPMTVSLNVSLNEKPSRGHMCTVNGCGKVIPKSLDLTYHKYLEHNIPLPSWTATYHCPICGRMCRTKAALSTHLSRMHADDPIPDEIALPVSREESPAL